MQNTKENGMCKLTLCLVMQIIIKAERLLLLLLFCNKDFNITNMGISALNSHAAGKKDINIVKGASIFFIPENQNESNIANPCTKENPGSTMKAIVIAEFYGD